MLHVVELPEQTPILERLQLEEALLRADDRNFCLLHFGSPRAIVMGISGNPDHLLYQEKVKAENIPVIRRFSGGGTVIVDEHTLFISFIFSRNTLPIDPYPEPILRWSEELYQSAWKIPGFTLRENDYCLLDRKCGGNAQYIRKDRWLLHTSFLWDYSERNMEALQLPQKQPLYREKRSHTDFLCRLKPHAPWQTLLQELKNMLVKRLYMTDFEIKNLDFKEHRKTTHQLLF